MMGIQGVSKSGIVYEYRTANSTSKQKNEVSKHTTGKENINTYKQEAATYETDANQSTHTVKSDRETIERLKADAEARNAQLRSLVKMFLEQGKTLLAGDNIYELLRTGKVNVDHETAQKAQQEISEDGYYGVEQTSERLVSFAKALSGNDPEKAEMLMDAVKKDLSKLQRPGVENCQTFVRKH